jgi:hypothetical protein
MPRSCCRWFLRRETLINRNGRAPSLGMTLPETLPSREAADFARSLEPGRLRHDLAHRDHPRRLHPRGDDPCPDLEAPRYRGRRLESQPGDDGDDRSRAGRAVRQPLRRGREVDRRRAGKPEAQVDTGLQRSSTRPFALRGLSPASMSSSPSQSGIVASGSGRCRGRTVRCSSCLHSHSVASGDVARLLLRARSDAQSVRVLLMRQRLALTH